MANDRDIELRLLDASDEHWVGCVFELAERHKKWLGVLAPVVYAENAAAGRILVAVSDGRLLGYVMFYVARRRVRVAHLCVEPDARMHGVGRLLVDELSRIHRDQDGISLRCRRDWDATRAWPKLGFEVRSNKVGRSEAGHLLTAWWRDHGHPDLFSAIPADEPRLVTAMDTNVFRDLHEPQRGPEAAQSRSLATEWLENELELVLTPGISIELNQVPDPRVREVLLATAQSGRYRVVGRGPAAGENPADVLAQAIVGGIPNHVLEQDPSLAADARLLAEAECGGAAAFVSRDENAVEHLMVAAAPFTDIWISTPTDLIVHLDEARDAVNYSPMRLRGTGYTIIEADARSEAALQPLLNNADGEKASSFRAQVRLAAQSAGNNASRRIIKDPGGRVVGAIFSTRQSGQVNASLFRAKDSAHAKTLANQLLHLLRCEALGWNARELVVTDPHVNDAVAAALANSGFQKEDGRWRIAVLRGLRSWSELASQVPILNREEYPGSPELAATIERIHWPLKVRDAKLPCYLVPIRPAPAELLFGQTQALWDSDAEIGLSRQHVYYRAPRPAVLTAPGRILWYVSGSAGEVVAASRIDQVVVAHPLTLYRRFRRLGILGPKVIAGQARGGRAMAVRFGDTEFFSRPVPLRRLLELNSHLGPLPSPREITEDDFFRVYEEGEPQ